MLHKKHDKAVSPIVGVILMVVLAILLSGLISQFSLELGNILQQPVTAGVNIQESYNVQEDTYDVRIVWSSGGTVESIYAIEPDGSQTASIGGVGKSITIDGVSPGERISIIGAHSNGHIGVIQEYSVG
jgi:flagellin-like protein